MLACGRRDDAERLAWPDAETALPSAAGVAAAVVPPASAIPSPPSAGLPSSPTSATPSPVRRSRLRRWVSVGAWACGLLLAVTELGWVLVATTAGADNADPTRWSTVGEAGVAPLNAVPVPGAAETAGVLSRGTTSRPEASQVTPSGLLDWAQRLSPRVAIPAVALAAYGSAELRTAA